MLAEKSMKLTWTDQALKRIAEKSYSTKYGARNMRRLIQTEIEDRIANAIINQQGQVSALHVNVRDGELSVQVL